jgi:hypothetical protein
VTDLASRLVRARFLVAALGESATPPWWRSRATSPTGQRFLARLFPRTHLRASLETATRAARLEHDGRIGRIGVYHLFRLPSPVEAMIDEHLQQATLLEQLHEIARVDSQDARLAALGVLADAAAAAGATGPVSCGAVRDLDRSDLLGRICATYLAGFRSGRPVYPYAEESG